MNNIQIQRETQQYRVKPEFVGKRRYIVTGPKGKTKQYSFMLSERLTDSMIKKHIMNGVPTFYFYETELAKVELSAYVSNRNLQEKARRPAVKKSLWNGGNGPVTKNAPTSNPEAERNAKIVAIAEKVKDFSLAMQLLEASVEDIEAMKISAKVKKSFGAETAQEIYDAINA